MTKIGRNDPCPCGSGRKYKHCCLGKREMTPVVAPEAPPLSPADLDPRAAERNHRRVLNLARGMDFATQEEFDTFVGAIVTADELPAGEEPHTPLERAQEIMYDAFAAEGDRRVKLAKQALEISPDCADAYVLLAEETARSAKAALPLYEQGVAAGERALGPDRFERYAGQFWENLDTRPYLRARFGFAQALAEVGRRDEAIEHARALLDLNPNDDQGAANMLLNQLILGGRDQEAAEVLAVDPDDWGTSWLYGKALVKFRLYGDGFFPKRALQEARATSPLVVSYLLGDKKPPKHPPASLEKLAEEFDAMLYVASMDRAWQETPGALDWMREVVKSTDHPPADVAERRTGPRFYLNPDPHDDVHRCPDCHHRTRERDEFLVILVEPSWLLTAKFPGRFCESCGLLTVHEGLTASYVAESVRLANPDDAMNPYVVLGIASADQPPEDEEAISAEWAIEHLQIFRELYAPEEDWDQDLAADDEADLLGPVLLLPPTRRK